jgi:hypothetical protein
MKRNKTFVANSKAVELKQYVRLASLTSSSSIYYNNSAKSLKTEGNEMKALPYAERSFFRNQRKSSNSDIATISPKITKTESFILNLNSGNKKIGSATQMLDKSSSNLTTKPHSELNDLKRIQRNQVCAPPHVSGI